MATLLAAFSSQALAKDGFVGLDWNFNPATSMTIDNPWWPRPENAIFVYVAETEDGSRESHNRVPLRVEVV
jgi:hypothetical protein